MTLCRSQGVIRASFHPDGSPAELLFGAPPVPVQKTQNGTDPRATKRAHYASMLNRTPSDAELDALP